MQRLPLPGGQLVKGELKSFLRLGFFKGGCRPFFKSDSLGRTRVRRQSQLTQKTFAVFGRGCLANYRKHPRFETRLTTKSRLALKDLQIDRLQNLFRFRSIAAATTQGPAETGAVKPF